MAAVWRGQQERAASTANGSTHRDMDVLGIYHESRLATHGGASSVGQQREGLGTFGALPLPSSIIVRPPPKPRDADDDPLESLLFGRGTASAKKPQDVYESRRLKPSPVLTAPAPPQPQQRQQDGHQAQRAAHHVHSAPVLSERKAKLRAVSTDMKKDLGHTASREDARRLTARHAEVGLLHFIR